MGENVVRALCFKERNKRKEELVFCGQLMFVVYISSSSVQTNGDQCDYVPSQPLEGQKFKARTTKIRVLWRFILFRLNKEKVREQAA